MSNANVNKFRQLSPQFKQDLMDSDKGKNKDAGLLFPLKDLVKNDKSLSLEIRDNYINIYYRGGSLLKLMEVRKHCYKPTFNVKYSRKKDILQGLPKEISSESRLAMWLEIFPKLKSEMDCWFSRHPKLEREFQQMVVWENNNSSIAKSTDYFIADIEYVKGDARFDMVAIQWDSDRHARRLHSYSPKLCFIEMKCGDAALNGTAGMLEHVRHWKDYLSQEKNKESIKAEMLKLFQQKRDLCLIAGLKDNNNEVKSFSREIDCIFLIANHDPGKSGLKGIINKLSQENQKMKIENPGVEIKFAVSNFMGYGLFKQNVIPLENFQELYKDQIYSSVKR